ncbi:MAG: N-acetylmuramoyl-L-alanine amidase [Sphingobium sp.]|nr:N-acetylmuramoyl-L-alanine amidase [Sphingobium sp.]
MNYRALSYGAGAVFIALLAVGGGYFAYAGLTGKAAGWGSHGVMHRLDVSLPVADPPLSLPPISGPNDPSLPLVVIDPGHGGRDPGAINDAANGGKNTSRLMEKDVTLALSRSIRDGIVAQGRVRVALTRDDDRYISLPERYEMARKMGAGLFLSIHADAAENEEAQGASIYTLSETASDREAARLAARENGGAVINGVVLSTGDGVDATKGMTADVSTILIDLSQRDAMRSSADFAQILYREAGPYIGFRGRWHRYASLVVLKAPDMPSALFEAGYISSAQDAARLADKAGRDKIAQGVARAVGVYFARLSDSR